MPRKGLSLYNRPWMNISHRKRMNFRILAALLAASLASAAFADELPGTQPVAGPRQHTPSPEKKESASEIRLWLQIAGEELMKLPTGL